MQIHLRPLEPADINEEYCSWFSNADGHLDYFTGSEREFSRNVLIEDYEAGKKTGRWFYYLILSDTGTFVGNVKIGPIDHKNKTSDLVCLVGNRDFLGKGVATQAIRMANQIAFKEHDIRRLQGGMYASNISSIKAYTKAGFVIEATFNGYYWLNGQPENRVCVACFNPEYFPEEKVSL